MKVTKTKEKQSRLWCVKCPVNSELSSGRKDYLAVPEPHPAATYKANASYVVKRKTA